MPEGDAGSKRGIAEASETGGNGKGFGSRGSGSFEAAPPPKLRRPRDDTAGLSLEGLHDYVDETRDELLLAIQNVESQANAMVESSKSLSET
eukprot:6974765-Pyramimonas_sp.AAC.1